MDELSSAEMALTALQSVVHLIGDDDLHRPTPCHDFDVAALADHLVETVIRLGESAGAHLACAADATVERRILQATRPVLTAWRSRGVAGEVEFSGLALPARLALGVLSLELVVHGWDFAVALRRPLPVSAAHAEFVLAMARETIAEESRDIGRFGQPVSVADDALAIDRLVAFTGRAPGCASASLRPSTA